MVGCSVVGAGEVVEADVIEVIELVDDSDVGMLLDGTIQEQADEIRDVMLEH